MSESLFIIRINILRSNVLKLSLYCYKMFDNILPNRGLLAHPTTYFSLIVIREVMENRNFSNIT